jgi:hypothetical protein
VDASVNFTAERGHEVPVELTVASPFEASVLDAAASPAGVDPLGRISAAHIKLESYVISLKAAKELHASIRPRFDVESEEKTLTADERLRCLSIQSRVTLSNNPSHYNRERKSCLLILPVEPDSMSGRQNDSDMAPRCKRMGFIQLFVDIERKGKLECPGCDSCKWVQSLAKATEPKTDEEKAAWQEKKQKQERAIGYGEWCL